MKRLRQEMPAVVKTALREAGLEQAYSDRPPYQRNDYLWWIKEAKRDETRQDRLSQMLAELKAGDRYMKMPYRAKD